jgi:acetate---CoA ligase (ADP-forming)
VPFDGPYVMKLADVAHRTEHGAVRLAVPADGLEAAVGELRALASLDGLPALVAVQPMVAAEGEAFIGIRARSELGPVVAFGLGGVFVQVFGRVSGRMAPFTLADATELIAEFDDLRVLDGLRGKRPWDRDALAAILVSAGTLAASGRDWIDTFDINPLVYGPAGFTAVDNRIGAAQRGIQAGAGAGVDPGLPADRHGFVASAFQHVHGELPDPAGRAGHCDPHRVASSCQR